MIRYLLLLSLILSTVVAAAQGNMDEVVYLRDGSSTRGLIIELVLGSSITIRDREGELHTYPMSEVVRIRRESKPPILQRAPFYASIEVGMTDYPIPHQTAYKTNIAMASVNVIAGAKFARKFYSGLGFGADIYNTHIYHLSAYWHMRAFFTRHKIAPYMDINAGYNGLILTDVSRGDTERLHENGGMANLAIGMRAALSSKVALTLSVGYKLVAFPQSSYSAPLYSDNDKSIGHGLTVRGGVQF